jgi:dihydroxyacid dehydratase/phosphogluconate dehydratase
MSTDIRQRPEGALLRTYLTAAGVGPDAIQKPLIGVATAATQVFSEKPDAKELGNAGREPLRPTSKKTCGCIPTWMN